MSDGYFPEGSILRWVHSERAVGLFYGQRALMIGALNPLAFVGTTEHTNAKQKPQGPRLRPPPARARPRRDARGRGQGPGGDAVTRLSIQS
jgi:hypothetical protein